MAMPNTPFAANPQFHPQLHPTATTSISTPIGTTLTSPSKDVTTTTPNMASLCKCGQEMIHDIISKSFELFQYSRYLQLPNGSQVAPPNPLVNFQERKAKIEEIVRNIPWTFGRLHQVYAKVKDTTAEFNDTQPEDVVITAEDGEVRGQKPKVTEASIYASDEYKDLAEQLQLRNQQLKEIVDKERTLLWEINTMIAMRKSDSR